MVENLNDTSGGGMCSGTGSSSHEGLVCYRFAPAYNTTIYSATGVIPCYLGQGSGGNTSFFSTLAPVVTPEGAEVPPGPVALGDPQTSWVTSTSPSANTAIY